jgi:hypothetical protein
MSVPRSSPSFAVTTGKNKVKLDRSGAARATFTVTNTSAQRLRGRLLARPVAQSSPDWFSVVGESVRDFAPNVPAQIVVQLNVPPDTPPGSYSFRLDAVSQVLPDEDFTEGPSVTFEIKPPPKPRKPIVPWVVVILGAIILLVVIGVLASK